ncbi:MAG: hypothetical protein V1743_07825 [Nanoarchaeota archaeon]
MKRREAEELIIQYVNKYGGERYETRIGEVVVYPAGLAQFHMITMINEWASLQEE